MKKIWCFASFVLIFLAIGVCVAEVPDLLGKWTGLWKGYVAEEDGSYKFSENMSINLTIVEQKDRLFTGNITYFQNGKGVIEGFAGAIGLDNKTLYMAEFDSGYDTGTLISDDEIELIYTEDGKMGETLIERLYRTKE
jgi:hypothetical protein